MEGIEHNGRPGSGTRHPAVLILSMGTESTGWIVTSASPIADCEMNIHKTCVKVVEEQCIGSLRNKKAKKNHRMSGLGLMENIKGKAGRRPQGGSQGGCGDLSGRG